jgi:hypothetical protein
VRRRRSPIEQDGDEVVWSDVAMSWPDDEAGGWEHDTSPFAGWAPLRFDARTYWSAITRRPAP